MKKVFALFLVFTLLFSVSVTVAAVSDKSGKNNGKGSGKPETKGEVLAEEVTEAVTSEEADTDATEAVTTEETETSVPDESANQNKKAEDTQKKFKTELNEQKKELQKQKSILTEQKEQMETQYEALLTAGETADAEALLENINSLNTEIEGLKSEIKKAINERFMIVKTMYTDAELAQFNSAADLITRMYEDAYTLKAGSITVNNNIIKFDAPAYLKGGVTLVPLRAIAEKLGAEVSWDESTQTVTVSKDKTVIKITANSTTVLIDGNPVEMDVAAEVTCGRTYIPLRFLAEALGLEVSWDGDNEIIDIDDGTDDTAGDTDETTAEETTAEETTAEETTAEETTSAETTTAETTAEETTAAETTVN